MAEGPVVPKGAHHSGFIVSDIDRSIAFYRDMFGAELGVRTDVAGPEAGAMQGLGDVDFTLAYVRFANDVELELIQYRKPANGDLGLAPPNQIGAGHIGLLYDNVDEAYEQLKARGMNFFSDPLHIPEGPAAGWVVAYGSDPDGNRIELLQQ